MRRPANYIHDILLKAAETRASTCVYIPERTVRPTVNLGDRKMYASRAVWTIAHGDPGDLHVLHTCGQGTQGCININHLYLGRDADNVADRIADGMQVRGHLINTAKLTDDQVRDIRQRGILRGNGSMGNVASLAAEFGVGRSAIHAILTRKTWRHI